MSIVAPGTMRHVGEKTVHLAATNMTHGESKNTNMYKRNFELTQYGNHSLST